jgi:oligosaccharide repeat unit polymerase
MYEWLLLFGIIWWLGWATWFLRRPFASAFHPGAHYLVFHGVLFAIRPVLVHWYQSDGIYRAIGFQPTLDDKITVLLAADLALAVFMLVSAWKGDRPFPTARAGRAAGPEHFTRSLWLMVGLCAPFALYSLGRAISTASGWTTSNMVRDMDTGMVMNTTGNGYVSDAQLMLISITALIAWAGRFRLLALAPLLLFVVVKAMTGGRYPLVMAVIATGLLYLWERRRRWPPARVVAAALPLLGLFTVLSQDRGQFIRVMLMGEAARQQHYEYFAERPLESMDYGNMEFFEYIVHVVPGRSGEYDLFASNSRILVEPIPRVLWEGKPPGAPISRVQLWRYGTSIGATVSVPGQGWLDLGWLGVVIWTGLFGLIYGMIYNRFIGSDQTHIGTALFVIFTATSIQCFRDGVLLTVLKTSFFPMVPVLVWWALRSWDLPVSRPGRPARPPTRAISAVAIRSGPRP